MGNIRILHVTTMAQFFSLLFIAVELASCLSSQKYTHLIEALF